MRLTKREKMLLAVLIFAVLFYGSYRFIVQDQDLIIAEREMEIAMLEADLIRLETIEDVEENLDKEIADVKSEKDAIQKNYFSLIEQQEEIILLLNEFLLSPDVSASSLSFTPPQNITVDEVDLAFMSTTLSYEANYPSLMNLLRSIWQFDRQVVLSSISMNSGENDTLTGSFTVDLYDLAHITGEIDPLFMWFQDMDAVKNNPFTAPGPEQDFQIRYVFRDSETAMMAQAQYIPFEDIEGHWAEDAIHGLGEMGAFPPSGSLNFEPDEPISRGEFIILLDRLYDWPMPDEPVDLTDFEDYDSLGRFESAVSRALFSGYLSGFIIGYEDNTLRPHMPISYEEVEFVMEKVLDDEDYQWEDTAAQIESEAGHSSEGLNDLDANMTRAEAAYFLYMINQ
ncbi:MAG: S-layer homology domain-containing protein [Tindallia sp. MSAO_Bac2]|nr:MAG: S-layer homology domain-containing protein [Tindallia sp. MSAO_Bac2]